MNFEAGMDYSSLRTPDGLWPIERWLLLPFNFRFDAVRLPFDGHSTVVRLITGSAGASPY